MYIYTCINCIVYMLRIYRCVPDLYCSSLPHAFRLWSGDGMFPDSLPTPCVGTSGEEGLVVPSSSSSCTEMLRVSMCLLFKPLLSLAPFLSMWSLLCCIFASSPD